MGLMSSKVPVLSCGGLAKRYICPGWRVGWIVMYNHNNAFDGMYILFSHRNL
jgi:tyrosine aminotransferase